MRRFPSSWDKTLAALGFRRVVKRIKRDLGRRRGRWAEPLERREMLAGDTPVLIQPEYFLVEETGADELIAPPFVVSTDYAGDGTPTAVVELEGGTPDYGLHEFSIELRLGDLVLETQEVAVNLTRDAFRSDFYRDRLQVVSAQVRSASVEEVEGWRDELGADGVFASVGDSTAVTETDDPLLDSAERLATMASLHNVWGDLLSSASQREALYAGVIRVATAAGASDTTERAEALRTELGRTALLIGETLEDDLGSGGTLAEGAAAARDAMLAVIDPYYRVLGVYGVNTDLSRSADGAFVESAVTVVEQGVFTLGDSLRVDVGEHIAFVGATIVGNGQAASSAALLSSDSYAVVADAEWSNIAEEAFETNPTIGVSTNSSGVETSVGRFIFDVSSSQGKVPTSATLKLTDTDQGAQKDLLLKNAWRSWDLLGDQEPPLEVDHESTVPALQATSYNATTGVYEFDVTEAIQRSLLLGDANADGDIDHDYQGNLQRRDLLADVNAAYLAIRDWDQYYAEYHGLEIVPGDLLYRVDANWDGVASATDGQLLLDRLGIAGGDFDLDGDVDVADLARYQANYGQVVQQFGDGDADFNGVVNAYDEDIWQAWYGNSLSGLHVLDSQPFFEVYLGEEGSVTLASLESSTTAERPALDLEFETDLVITDFHGLDHQGLSALASHYEGTGKVTVEYSSPQAGVDTIVDATAQLYRVPSDGTEWEPIGNSYTLGSISPASSGSHTFALSDLNLLQKGDGLAVEISSASAAFSHSRLISSGIVSDEFANIHVFGTAGEDTSSFRDDLLLMSFADNTSNGFLLSPTFFDGFDGVPGFNGFNQISFHLDGSDDSITVDTGYLGGVAFDGGSGDDSILSYVDFQAPLKSVSLEVLDTQGINSFQVATRNIPSEYGQDFDTWVTPYFSETLDPDQRDEQTLTFVYDDDYYYENEPHREAAEYQITLTDAHSLTYADANDRTYVSVEEGRQYLTSDTLIVDTLSDQIDGEYGQGELSLREALELAELMPGTQTIEFNQTLFGQTQERIQLTSGTAGVDDYVPRGHWGLDTKADLPQPYFIHSGVEINGPGADLLALDGWGQNRVFVIDTPEDVAIRDLTVTGGYVDGGSHGGGLYTSDDGDLLLERTIWSDNHTIGSTTQSWSGGHGGAIAAFSTNVEIVDSTFELNDAQYGGAIFFKPVSGEELLIKRSTLSQNTATKRTGGGYGSAAFFYASSGDYGGARIESSTISGNHAQYAGAIYVNGHNYSSQLRVEIDGSTVVQNTVDGSGLGGAGIFDQTQGVVELNNTILVDNVQDADGSPNEYDLYHYNRAASVIGGNNNLIGVTRYPTETKANLLTENAGNIYLASNETAGLLPLDFYGGLTKTHALAPDSPVIDEGNDAIAQTLGTDQRGEGYSYLRGGQTDIGAYEGAFASDATDNALVIRGTDQDDEIIVAPGVVYLGGIGGKAIPFDLTGYSELHVHGDGGNDRIVLMPGVPGVTLFGDHGDDVLIGSSGNETLDGGADDDQLFGRGGIDIINGGAGNDTLYGGDGNDYLYGQDGHDTLFGGAGDDQLHGNADNDLIDGGLGADQLYGGAGDDRLVVGDESESTVDIFYGDLDSAGGPTVAGNDEYVLPAADNQSLILSAGGVDTIDVSHWETSIRLDLSPINVDAWQTLSEQGAATVYLSGTPITRVLGTEQDDVLIGSAGDEMLDGRGGDDKIIGGGGFDHLLGGGGNDDLIGWDANPVGDERLILDGGYGDDHYWITDAINDNTVARIRDQDGEDTLHAGAYDSTAGTFDVAHWSASHGVTVNLSQTHPQQVYDNGTHEFVIDLPGEAVIENVSGTDQADHLTGNSLQNTLEAYGTVGNHFFAESDDTVIGPIAAPLPALGITLSGGSYTTDGVAGTPDQWDTSGALSIGIGQGEIKEVTAAGTLGTGLAIATSVASGLVALDLNSPLVTNGLPTGTYPLTLRIEALDGRVAVVLIDALFDDGTNPQPSVGQTPTVTTPGAAVLDPNDPDGKTYEFAFSVNDADAGDTVEVRLAGDLPSSLRTAYEADPSAVLVQDTGNLSSYLLKWPTEREDAGTHSFRIEATDSGVVPRRYSLPVTLTVPEHNEPLTVKQTVSGFEVDFSYTPNLVVAGGFDERADPSFDVTLINDNGFEDVRVVVDWSYDGTAFEPDQYLYGRDFSIEGEEWKAHIVPDSHTYFTIDSLTQVAFRVEEYDNATSAYVAIIEDQPDPAGSSSTISSEIFSSDSSGNQLTYKPVESSSLSFDSDSWGLLDDTDHSNTDVTIVGSLDNNSHGTVAGLRVEFYVVDASQAVADRLIGTATTNESGAFEFAARAAFDLDVFSVQTSTIRAKVQDPAPTLPPVDPSVDADLVTTAGISGGEDFTLEVPEAPVFNDLDGFGTYLIYDDAPRLEGLGFIRQPRVTGELASVNVPVDEVTVRFTPDVGSWESIAITDSDGEFEFLPPLDLSNLPSQITAEVEVWHEFRERTLPTASVTLPISSSSPVYTAPAITGFSLDGSPYLPIVSGSVVSGGRGLVVQIATDADFTEILGETLTDETGAFEYRAADLERGQAHSFYARTIGWNHWASEDLELETGPITIPLTVSIPEAPATPTLVNLDFAIDTGTQGDLQSAVATWTGQVAYAGDMLDIQVEYDTDGDGRAEGIVLPDEEGYFQFTPSGLSPGDSTTITAWAVAPDFGDTAPDFDAALQEAVNDGPTNGTGGDVGWSEEQYNGESAKAWLDELFQSDDTLGGAWYEADFAPDLNNERRSDPLVRTFTFLDPSTLTYAVSASSSGGTTFSGQVVIEGDPADHGVADLDLEVFVNQGGNGNDDDWVIAGRARTDQDGNYSVTPSKLPKDNDQLKLVLHKPIYDELFATDAEEFFVNPYGSDVAYDASLDAIALTADASAGLVDHSMTAPVLRDRVANDMDLEFNPAGWLVEFDLNENGRPDAQTFTDGQGYYEYDFSDWSEQGDLSISARVVSTSWSEADQVSHQVHSKWKEIVSTEDAWAAVVVGAPEIQQFELLNDTGNGVSNERILDRITTDPTVVGRVINAPAFSTVEFSHSGDGITIDGYASTDEYGRFEYVPAGLTAGFWDLQARITKVNESTGVLSSSLWRSITAAGDPSDTNAAVGFELINATAAVIQEFELVNDSNSSDARLHVLVTDVDTVDNVFVDIYEVRSGENVLIATTALEADGTAEVIPYGLTTGSATLTAVAREIDPYTGQSLLGAETPPFLVEVADSTDLSASSTNLYGAGESSNWKELSVISPIVYGTTEVDSVAQETGGIPVPVLTPLQAALEITYTLGSETLVEYGTADYVAYTNSSNGNIEYRFSHEIDLDRWPDGIASNDKVSVRTRGVGLQDGAVVLGSWGNPIEAEIKGSDLSGAERPSLDLEIETRYDSGSAAALGNTTADHQTLAAVLTPSITTTLESLGDEVYVESRYLEISTSATTSEEVEYTIALDEGEPFDLSDLGLGYGEIAIDVRLVEEARIDETWDVDNDYKDAFESSSARRIAGEWKELKFTLVDTRPSVVEGSLGLVGVDTSGGSGTPEAVDPVVEGTVTSSLYGENELGGLTVEYDLDGDGLIEGSTLTYADGSFEFSPTLLTSGDYTVQIRVVDYYGGEETLTGEWTAFDFKRVSAQAPGFEVGGAPGLDPGVDVGDTIDGIDITYTPVIQGVVPVGNSLTQGLSDLEVEFDYDGDGIVDESATVEVDGSFSHDASDVAFGEVSVRYRTAAWNGSERVYSVWSDSDEALPDAVEFFHASEDAPSITLDDLAADFATTGQISGRATINGFGAGVSIEIVTVSGASGSEVEHLSYSYTDSDGLFTATPPRLVNGSNGTQKIRVRGVTTLAGETVPGEWNQLDIPSELALQTPNTLALPIPGTIAWSAGSFQAAYPLTQVGGAYGDPTIQGTLTGDYAGALVEIDYDGNGLTDATVSVDLDGHFTHTPTDLTPNQAYAVEAKWKRWNPDSGEADESGWVSLAGGSLTFDPTVGGAPAVTEFELSDLVAGATSELTPFYGTVTGNGQVAGLTVWFDHDGDGVADGKTLTRADGEFTYYARGINSGTASQTLTAWVDPPEYSEVAAAAPFAASFTLATAPQIASVVFHAESVGRITGQVDWEGQQVSQVEYWFSNSAADGGGTSPTPGTLTNASSLQRAWVSDEGRFHFAVPVGATNVLVRAVAGDTAGFWKQLELKAVQSDHALPIGEVRLAYPDSLDADVSADPTVVGRVGGAGEGAFAVVEVLYRESAFDPYEPIGRVTADARGEFLYKLPAEKGLGLHDLSFRTVGWDAETQIEPTGEATSYQFEWIAGAPVISLTWDQTGSTSGAIDDPTVVGTVVGAGRKAGIRVEFNHDGGSSVDGFAYTDANGQFRYTPIGVGGAAPTTLTITARVSAWDASTNGYEAEDFSSHAAKDSVGQISATLAPNSISPFDFTDLSSDEMAIAGLQDAVFATLTDLNFAGADGTIDVGLGDVALLHRGGGESADEFDQPVFEAATSGYTVPVASSTDSDYHLITPSGGVLTGSYTIVVDTVGSSPIQSVNEISFHLVIDSYVTNVGEDTSGGAQLADQVTTRLELAGEYEFIFSTDGDASYNGLSELTDFDHFITEIVNYDYAVVETASTDGPLTFNDPTTATTSVGDHAIGSRYTATGGSEYTFALGDATEGPAQYDVNATGNAYSAPLTHTETTRVEGYGDAGGSVSADSDSGVTVDRTYVETVAKTGTFEGADSPNGTIKVTSLETIVTTTDTLTTVAEGGEFSSEHFYSNEVVVRTYSGSAYYAAGVSIDGSGTLTETTTYESEFFGMGTATTGDTTATFQTDRWDYEGEAFASSTFLIGGTFFESLNLSSPRETSDYSGSFTSGSKIESKGEFTSFGRTIGGDGEPDEFDIGGGNRLDRTTSLGGEFSGNSFNDTSHLEGDYLTTGEGLVKDWSEGRVTERSNDSFEVLDFRNLTLGEATNIETTVSFSSDVSPEAGRVLREEIEHDVIASGIDLSGAEVRGHEPLGDGGKVAYFGRVTTDASVDIESKGTALVGSGSADGSAFTPEREGTVLLETGNYIYTLDSAWTKDSASTDISVYDEVFEQLSLYEDEEVEATFEREIKTTDRHRDAAFYRAIPEEHTPGEFPEEPDAEDFEGGFNGSTSGADIIRTTFGSYSDGGPDGRTEDITYKVEDNRNSTDKNTNSRGESGEDRYDTYGDSESISNGGHSTGAGGADGGSSGSYTNLSNGGAFSFTSNLSDDDQNRSFSSGTSRVAGTSDSNSGAGNVPGSSNNSGDGNNSGEGMSASTSVDGDFVTNSSSSGSSSGEGESFSNGVGTADDANYTYGQKGEGESESESFSSYMGPGVTSWSESTTSGSGLSGGGGSAELTRGDVRPDGDSWGESSSGETTTSWGDETFGSNGSYSEGSGSSTSGGGQGGGGTAGPDGSSASANSSSNSESDAESTSLQVSWFGAQLTVTTTKLTHEAKGGGSQNVTVEDSQVTEVGGTSGGGGENQEVITRVTVGPGYASHSKDTYTTTSNQSDVETTGTDKHEWEYTNTSSSVPSASGSFTFSLNTGDGESSETVTRGGEKDTANTTSKAHHSTLHVTSDRSSSGSSTSRNDVTTWSTTDSSSSYDSSHKPGAYGATGGSFTSKGEMTVERGTARERYDTSVHSNDGVTEYLVVYYHNHNGDPLAPTAGNSTSTTTTTWSNNGSYEDTAKGRQQSGTQTVTSDTTSTNDVIAWGIDSEGSDLVESTLDITKTTHLTKTTEYSNTQTTITSESRETGSTTQQDIGWPDLDPAPVTKSYVIVNGVPESPDPPAASQSGEESDDNGQGSGSGPSTSTGGGAKPTSVDIVVQQVNSAFLRVPLDHPASQPYTIQQELNDIYNSSYEVTYGGETRRVGFRNGNYYVFDLIGNLTGEYVTFSKSVATGEETLRFTPHEDNEISLDNGVSTLDLALEVIPIAKGGRIVENLLHLIPSSVKAKAGDLAKKLGSKFGGSKGTPAIKSADAPKKTRVQIEGKPRENPGSRVQARQKDKWRRAPENLQEQLALEAAKKGAGRKIIDNLGDPKFKGFEKWEYKVKSDAGADAVVHYVRNPATGELLDFKFK